MSQMTESTAAHTPASAALPWGDAPYDSKTPAEVVHDYVRVRGDLSEQYARDQLALWIERYAAHAAADALRGAADALDDHTACDCEDGDHLTRLAPSRWLRSRADRTRSTQPSSTP